MSAFKQNYIMEEPNENYIRWQNYRITQLGFAINLLIILAVGLIAFTIKNLQSDLILNSMQKILFWFGSFLTLSSIGIGLFVVVNRLEDFRITAQIALKRGRNENTRNESEKAKKIGKNTWNGFIWQVVTFIIGFLCLLIMFVIALSEKIT